MKTLKELKAAKQVKVQRHAVHQRDWELIRFEALAELERVNKEYGVDGTYTEKDNGIYFSSGRFILKPKYPAKMVGTVQLRSADYIFVSKEIPQGMYGDIPRADALIRNAEGNIVGWVVATHSRENINYTII